MKSNPTVSTYDKYHDVYDNETIEFWKLFPPVVIQSFVSSLPGKRILNIGSGPGRDALILKDQGLDVMCVDASKEMVTRTKFLGFESRLMDMREIDFPPESFDGIWAYTSLLHIPKADVKIVLHKFSTCLKDNGVILCGMIEGSFDGDIIRESMPNAKRYFRFYTEDEITQVFTSAGFELLYQNKYQPNKMIYLNQIYRKIPNNH